jgi:hypothetical protein
MTMRRSFTALAPLLLLLMAGTVTAETFEVSLNDNSVQAQYGHLLGRDNYGAAHLQGRLLYGDRKDTLLGSLGLDFSGEPLELPGLELAVGLHLVGGETRRARGGEDLDLLSLGIGGRIAYAPAELHGLSLAGRAFYGPKILSFLDAERLIETGLRLGFAVTPVVQLFVDYQNMRVDFENRGYRTVDDSLRVGFAARF